MHDAHDRHIRYLRLSLTPACGMRCIYCRPTRTAGDSGPANLDAQEIVTLIGHLVREHGLTKVRLTGGEPTMRPDLVEIVRRLEGLRTQGLEDLGLTTNGMSLRHDALPLYQAGLRRLNVSLDSLDPGRFARITGRDALADVLAGLGAAVTAGLAPIKLNTVVLRGENERDLPALVGFAAAHGFEIRFIELMPMGPLAGQWAARYVSEAEMRERLGEAVVDWRPLPRTTEVARRYRVTLADGRAVTIGFITAMSQPFCDRCDRIRITADGNFYPCLMDRPAGNLLPAIRPVFRGELIDDLLRTALRRKADVHSACGHSAMIGIGG